MKMKINILKKKKGMKKQKKKRFNVVFVMIIK